MRATFRRLARSAVIATVSLTGIAGVVLIVNGAPAVPHIADADARPSETPIVVKLHARWCYLCMLTRGVWSEIEGTYAGRVKMVVFDFTTDATTQASEAEARRLGLGALFEEYAGVTGTILVLNGRNREIIDDLHGTREFEPYRAAIAKALQVSQY